MKSLLSSPPVGSHYWERFHGHRATLAQVFYRAERIVNHCGWWHGPETEVAADPADDETISRSGRVCIATAVSKAACLSMQDQALIHLKTVLGLPLEPGSLADWNDDPTRTVQDIIDALRLAASAKSS